MKFQTLKPPAFENKILSLGSTSAEILKSLQVIEKPIVFTNGVFDILHRGHVTYLAQAKNLGKSLVVGVNSDTSVKMLGKGNDRPINSELDRMALLRVGIMKSMHWKKLSWSNLGVGVPLLFHLFITDQLLKF